MASAAAANPASLPKLIFLAPGSVTNPAGTLPTAASAPGSAASTSAAPASAAAPAQADPAVPAPGTPQAAAQTGAAHAKAGASMVSRLLGVLPLLTGVTQLLVGLAITRGTLPMSGIPLIGALPKFLVGGLVAGSSTTSIMQGIGKLLGKTPKVPGMS